MLINIAMFISPLIIFFDNIRIYVNITIFIVLILISIKIIKNPISSIKLERYIDNYFKSMKEMFSDSDFFKLWILSILIWASCSFIYLIIPAKKLLEGTASNINIWLMIDSFVVICLFYIIKKLQLYKEIKVSYIIQGISILGISLIFISLSHNIFMLFLSVLLLAIGGTISFPQVYGMMAKIAPEEKKLNI
jgi:hypothetical protein